MAKGITKIQREAIKAWLKVSEYDKPNCCPSSFTFDEKRYFPCEFCYDHFPILKLVGGCPCSRYDLSEVIEKAKELIGG